jgi:hypothetical protein
MKKKNDDLKIGAFLAPDPEVGGVKMRPFSAGSYLLCQRRGLTLFTGDGAASEADQMWQMIAFLYIHSAPIEEVLIAGGNEEAFRKAVDAYAFNLSPSVFREAIEKITEICQQVGAASVTVESKPGSGSSKETPPPNS